MSYELKNIPHEVIDFSKPPSERWIELTQKYKSQILNAFEVLDNRIYQLLGNIPKTAFNSILKNIINLYGTRNYYYDELKSIANILDIDFYKVVMCQYGYELFSACTSAVISIMHETVHLRTMDWDDNSLRPLTINLKIINGSSLIGIATTWIGFVGFFTIAKPGICSVSVNYRSSHFKQYHKNLFGVLTGRMPISYLVREAILNNDTYDKIINVLQTTPLSAPVYLTVACTQFEKSMIITRDCNDAHIKYIDINEGYLIQTNIDWNDTRVSMNDKKSIERRATFINKFFPDICMKLQVVKNSNQYFSNYFSNDALINNFLIEPILKYNTIYVCIIKPAINDESCLYSKKIIPGKNLELMIKGWHLKFWNQIPPNHYESNV
jgi:hypothetical protein